MNRLSTAQRAQIFSLISEGNSLRAASRLSGVAFNTVLRASVDIGRICEAYQDRAFRGLNSRRLQFDELHSFVGSRERTTTTAGRKQGKGETWVWLAIDADTKLVPSWHSGKREFSDATTFVNDVASRLACRPQVSTDGHAGYLAAIAEAFGDAVDYGMLIKQYGLQAEGAQGRYAPPICTGAIRKAVIGEPIMAITSTSYIERLNLSLRMGNRRFTRLTNAFSKTQQNHRLSLASYFMFYNFCRIHRSLRVTPAMEAGLTNHVWEPSEVIELLEIEERRAA